MRTGQNARVGGQQVDASRRSRRPLMLRVALLAGATMVLLGMVPGCVQSPVANPASLVLTDDQSTSQAYTPDTVPVAMPPLGSNPDISTPSGDDTTPAATDPGAVPTMQVPTATKAGGTTAPGQAATQTAQAQAPAKQAPTTAAPATSAPTTAQATAAKTTTAPIQALVGPGQVELRCTHASDGRTKAVLKWDNPGFTASVTVNGRTTYATGTKATSLTAYATETTPGHGICTGRVGDSPAANSY